MGILTVSASALKTVYYSSAVSWRSGDGAWQGAYNNTGSRVGVLLFSGLGTILKDTIIKSITLKLTINSGTNAADRTITFCKSNYQSVDTGKSGAAYVGTQLGALVGNGSKTTGTDSTYPGTQVFTLNGTTNAGLFNALASYLQDGNTCLLIYNGETANATGYSYSLNYLGISACTMVIEYDQNQYLTSAGAVTLGKACNVLWTPLSASFRYKLKFSMGNWSHTTGLIWPNTTAAYTYDGYTIPLEAAEQIPEAPKGIMTVTLTTYSDSGGTTQVGTGDSKTFQVTVPDNGDTQPAVEMTLHLVTDLASPFDVLYIQNLTKVDAHITAQGQYGASVGSCQLVIGSSVYSEPYITGLLTQTGEVTVTGKAVDSRGFTGKNEQTITVIPYSKPVLVPADGETDIVCARCDGNGNLSDSGTNLRITAKRSYSPVVSDGEQHNFCQIRYRVNGGSWVTILDGNAAENEVDTVISGAVPSITTAYLLEIGVVDEIGYEANVTVIVPTDQVEFNLREGGSGAAFGEYAEEENVVSIAKKWELKVKGTASIDGSLRLCSAPIDDYDAVNKISLLDLVYPVGSIYMSVSNVSPATFLGGTWERIKDQFLLASGEKFLAGATGGEINHQLTAEELPKLEGTIVMHNGENFTNVNTTTGVFSSLQTGSKYANVASLEAFGATSTGVIGFAVGNDQPHNNMPPYLAVYIWKRTA